MISVVDKKQHVVYMLKRPDGNLCWALYDNLQEAKDVVKEYNNEFDVKTPGTFSVTKVLITVLDV